MPVENDTSHQNGQEDTGGGGGNGNVRSETSSVPPRPATEPNATTTIVNGTHPKVASTTAEEQLAQDSPKDAKKTDGSASFLRAARAGNLEKVLEFLKTNTDIDTCNANGLNALHLASKEGHVNVVRELLQRGANVDAATKKGNTALHIASLAGQEEIVKVLVQHQALVNIQSQNGFTPLYMAAQENHDSVVRFLLANNANQSLATEDGFTPLAVALQQGHDKVVAVLLENDTRGKVRLPALHIAAKKDDTKAAALLLHTDHNPDVTSKSGFTPLHIAAHYGNENIANLLIQRGADVNYIAKHQITPLHVASKWGKGNMVSLLIDKGANYEAKTRDGLTPLHCAARSGHETVVDMLLEKGAPITSKTKNGLAPLHMASQGDHVDAARILLYHKAPVDDVTVDFLTALHVAAHCGHVRVAKLLLDRKADPNSRALNGFTPLHIACKKNRIKVVELLLKHGASIEATTESGLTPLHVASFMGCMNIVIYLIQHGASADVPTVRGETPLHLAARANQTDIIRILLRNGAQVDARAREQQTALHIASRLGNSDIVVLLLQHGAAVDATTKDHYTALHIAAKEGQEEVASVLLEHGASLTSTTKKGFTPLHLAAKYGNMKVARLLLQKDAPVDAQGKNGVTPLHVAAHYDHQNVALLLLDKGASPHATAKNGYTPLHIAARKNQMDIATTLLEYGASANAESKAGFTPLHLSSQEGHTDMATLLIEHNAAPGACAKNGLTPLHLCAQEDRVNVAAILVKHGAQIDPATKAGYTPLHVACHFGQMNMVRFLLQHGAKVDSTTQLGYTPLHQAAQQGHTQIVNLLLENKAEPNTETNDGKTALSIAQRLGYISVVETLKIVTETTINTTTTTVTEEKYKVVVPETMHETFMSESEDEGGDDTMLGDQSYRYLTVDEMKSLGDDSLPIDVTKDEKMDVSFISNTMAAPPVAPADQLSPQHQKEQHYAQFTGHYPSDNVDVAKTPILAGFLVSFMVDARGGAMRGCRHSGVRVIIPPRKAAMPMRVTCRYLKKDKLVHAPPLMEGEALASRILEMGPAGAKFLGPVIIEVPHFASLRGKEREIVILRSDNGETWREHTLEATEEAVQEVLNESFDGEELKQLEDLNTNRITRILTTDFPQYFAIVTRIRQEVHAIGPEGGMVSSTVVPQVQAVFPQGALTKKIKVGLQAQPIPTDLVAKLLGNRVAVSPIVTVEPRRRKFHKPITLTIPVPQASSKGMINQYSGEAPTLRLLCSITGGTTRAQWEDVTGSTPLTFVNDCVSFTTTVSARFWLMDCSNIPEATKMATELYREAIHVPFMAKFVVFSKRHQLEEARVRVFCMTDDREDKTLEHQELFVEVAKSRDVEVLEGKPQFLEFAGNLVPVTKSGDQLAFNFYAFRENRLPFTVRVKDQHADPIGRVAFMRQPKVGRGDPPQTPICNLNIALPDNIQPEPAPSEPDLLALEKKYSFLSISKADTIHKADLRLTDISNMLGTDWVALAHELEISDSDINIIKSQYPDNAPQQAIVMLRLWMQTSGNKANGNTLEKGLRKIRRDDIVNQCIFNVELVTDDIERAMAKAHLDQSGFETFKEELGPSRDTTLNRDVSLDVSYDEQDMMKEAESAEEEEENQRAYQEKSSREQRTVDMSPTYESEEKKYAGEEKVVTEEKVTREELRDGSSITISTTSTTVIKEPTEKSKLDTVIKETTEVEPIEEMKLDSTKEQIIPEPIKEQIVPEPIKEQIVPEPIKEQIVPEPIKEQIVPEPIKEQIVPEPIKEQIVPEPIEEIISEPMEEHISPEPIKEQIVPEPIKETKVEPSVTEFVALKPVEGSAAETEEIISEEPLNILEKSKTEFTVAEAEKDMIEKYEQLLEQEALEKPIFKITEKPAEVEDKIEVVDDVPEDIGASEVEDSKEIQTTVVREVVSGPEGTPTSTTTTQRETYTTSEDGTVQEHIVVTKQITKTVGGLELDEEDKSLMLQKLGEELGRLDEKLEEKFKEKRKTDEPEVTQEEVKEEAVVAMRREDHAQPTSQVVVEYGSLPSTLSVTTTTTTTTTSITPTPDGFTQTSVESSQMSSTRGTAEVSFPGTTTTADESLKQMGQGTHEAAQLVEQQTPPVSYEEASSGHPTSGTKAGSDGGLHGGCPEAQGMDWEGKSVDSMYTETVVQAKLSMLPEVDTSEGVAPTSPPSSTLPPAASSLSTTSLCSDLPHITNIQPQIHTFQDLTKESSQTLLHLEPSHLHDFHSVESQGFDTSPSSATKLSDPIFLEKGHVSGAEATVSHLVTSPSFASLLSESVAPITGTDEIAAASVTFNTSSAFVSLGPISPTENSSEDHAEIDCTSTELSPDSVRFEQDILDTRTEDEAPDIDDDLFPASPVLGPELSERIFSVEATEDTDITTPMEMRDSHTERDASASNLEFVDDKEGTDLLKECLVEDKDESIAYLTQEVKEVHNKVNRLQEQVEAQVDPITASSEIKIILNSMEDIREAVGNDKIENNPEFNSMAQDILSNINSLSETVAEIIQKLHLSDPEYKYSEFWSKDETKAARRTESTIVETGSAEDGSPSDANHRDQSFSDLLDSEELNRDSLEEEFDLLAADLSLSPKAADVVELSPKATSSAAPSVVLSSPVSSNVYPSTPPDALQATQREPDVGVVFTEHKEYGGRVKPSAETTGGHSHISPSPSPHPSQSIQSSSFTSFQQKLPGSAAVTLEEDHHTHDECPPPSRPVRRHERTFSQASNIFTGAIPTEPKHEPKKEEKQPITEESTGITENIKPYSERKQFWESVTSHSFESKGSTLIKSETESDTDTIGTDGTIVERKTVQEKKVTAVESTDSETEYIRQRDDPAFYENAGFAGTERIDVPKEISRERAVSPFEVLRTKESVEDLPSPEDIAYKDVSSKRALFEKEIKRQSMEIEESQSWKRSSKEYDETVVITEELASSLLKKKEESEHQLKETIEKGKDTVTQKMETKKDDVSKTDIKRTEIKSKTDKTGSKEDHSETVESSKLHHEKMETKEKKVISEVSTSGKKSMTQTDASTEKKEKESTEKAAKVIHERKDSHSGTFSKTISKSEEKTESSSEAKETIHIVSTEDQDTSRDEITEEDMTRTEETSEEEPDDVLSSDRTTVNITEESRQVGDTHETVIRETTTTRDGDQEQRIIKETKTQETAMADGSTIKTTSITTFTTQLDTKETDNLERQSKTRTETFEKHMAEEPTENFQEEKHIYSGKTAKEKSEAFVEQRMKSDIFSEELSSSAEDQSPEHKVITPIDTKAPVSLQTQVTSQPKSPILLPKENVQEIVWEVSQEQSEIVMSETVQDIPVQQPFKSHFVKDISVDDHKKSQKTHRKSSSGSTKTKLSEEEARKLAIEIVEEVKTEAVKRSPLATPSQSMNEFSAELQDVCDGSVEQSLPRATPESAFTEETTTKIEKYIQEQLGDDMDEKQLKLIESVTARKTEMLHKKMVGSEYQQSMEITDEDLRSSGAELSPIEHQMERLRQMTEDDDNQRFPREPSEADESESSMIIHESVDDIISSEYDQANQMISKTLDALKTADINKIEKSIETIKEMPDTIVKTTVIVKEGIMSDAQELIKLKQSEVTETARKLVKEVTEKAKESEAVKQASLPTELRQASGSWEQSKSPSPKSGSKPSSRKGSWMDDDELRRDFRRDYEDKKKMFKEEMTSDKQDVFDGDAHGDKAEYSKITHQKSSESHKEIHMESSMTESMEESSTVESIRSFEGKLRPEVTTSVIKEQREVETEKKQEERSFSSYEEVVMRKKTHVDEFNRRSGTDFDTCSSSGESHYFTAAEGASDSRTASRPCSSDVEALMSERTGTSEYDTALTSQDTSQYSSYSTSSQDYRTPGSSLSSRDSMKSIDSESSGNLASVELSEASETLVPSAVELEKDMDLLEQELFEEELSHSTHHTIIPQLTIQSDTPKSEEMPCAFDVESDEGEFDQETKDEEREAHITSRMKRSIEMTFHPEPKPLTDDKKASVTESVASSLEESTLSEMSIATVIEQDKSMQGSTTDSNMSTSSVSEHMVSSVEGQEHDRHISRADSGVLTTETGDGDMALHSVTITATSVPSSTPDQNTASMCTQVTSETRSQVELTESEQFFHANGPTEVDYVPEYDDEEVQGARPVAASIASPTQEVAEAVAGPSEGPEKVIIVEECYETEADQEYGQMMRECEYSEMAEAELQYSLEEQPEAEMSSMLVIDEPLERPRTPEPGYVSSSRPSPMIIQSPDEPEEFTEVDKRFSAVFSTTYEEREEGASARSLVSGMSIDVPDITITEHTLPMPSQYCYPDLEREEDFPECRALAEADASAQEIPATPGSQESASSCPSRKSSSTDSEQGREYCLDDIAQGLPFESFEMVEAEDIDDFSEYERTLCMHEERMLEMSQIREEDEEEVEEARKTDSSPIQIPSQLKAVKLETDAQSSSDSQAHDLEDLTEVGPDPTIEEQRRWLELQFEESDAAKYDYPQGGFLEHVYSGPLEDIEEERDEAERRDLSHIAKTSSLSSTPEYDVLAGRKFFTRSGDHDDISMSSLQEFENLERAVAVEAVARRSSSGSQESLNGKRPESKSGQGDDISVGSFASLQEFERLERECLVVEQIEKKAQEEEAMLSEIEEGHESQVSESESCETLSEPGRGSVEGEEYDQRMFEIDEIIRQAQNNVERSDQNKPGYEGVQLKDIVSVDGSGDDGTSSSQADRTPSVGREDGDADSLEEAQLPELDMDHPAAGGTSSSTKQDAMTLSTDSIEALSKQKVPRETSQDSLEKLPMRTSDPMATSIDSIDLTSRQDPMTASTDSLEGRRKRQDPMSASTDSIDPCRRDGMTTSIDSLGRDDSSGRDADISSGSEQVRPLGKDGLMECSTDSLEPSSSQATHATYQYDTDSVMSGSFTSGCSNTLIASTDEFPDVMTSSMYLPEGQLPTEGDEQYVKYMHASGGSTAEMVTSSTEPGFSHSITRVVRLPPEAHKVTFTGPDAQRKLEEYIQEFNAGQHSSQDEVVDDQGNVHIRRVTQTRVVTDPSHIREHGFSLSEPSTQETETRDEYGNVTRVIRRTVVTSQTIEVDLDTGEPIIQPGPTSSSSSSSSFSRIPRPVTSPPLASRPTPPGPPPGSRGPHEPVPPSLEPNTVSGLGVEEMSSVMESYTSDGSDPITTTHITRYDPDPLTTTTTTTTHTTRIIRRTQGEDGEVKEEIFEEY